MKKAKKIWGITLSTILSFAMILAFSQPAFAKEARNMDYDSEIVTLPLANYGNDLSEFGVDYELVLKVLDVAEHIYFNEDNTTLKTDLSDDTLYHQYEFSEKQVNDFHAILAGTYQPPTPTDLTPTTRAARFYLSNYDLTAGVFAVLGTAAAIGPAALMAAWTSISTALAGPLGTIAGIGVAALGATFFADLALKITGAIVQGKGVAFYLDWGIPPVSTAIE